MKEIEKFQATEGNKNYQPNNRPVEVKQARILQLAKEMTEVAYNKEI